MNLKTSGAWLYKQQMVGSLGQPDAASGARSFDQWYRNAMRSCLPKFMAVAGTLKAHLARLLTYLQHSITNALTERFNSKLQAIKADDRGLHRFTNCRSWISLFGDKLFLCPQLLLAAARTIP